MDGRQDGSPGDCVIQEVLVSNIRHVDSGPLQGLCDVTLKGSDLGPLNPLTFHECRFIIQDPEQPPWPTLPRRGWIDKHLRDGHASLATVPLPVFQEIQRLMLWAWGEEFGEPDTLEKFREQQAFLEAARERNRTEGSPVPGGEHGGADHQDNATATGLRIFTVRRHLKELHEQGLVSKDGNHPNVHWSLQGNVYEFSVAASRIVEQRKVLDAVRQVGSQGTTSTLIAQERFR